MSQRFKKILNSTTIFTLIACFSLLFAGKTMSLESVESHRLKMLDGNRKSLVKLVNAYKDKNQPLDVRLEALRAISESRHPSVVEAIQEAISEGTMIELDIMLESIDMLADFGASKSAPYLVKGLKSTESKIMSIRESIVSAIGSTGSEDEILTLLELYKVSKINHDRMNRILAYTLGEMDDQRAIPVLMEIASDENIEISTRATAVEILAKKDAPELVNYFIELLSSPETKYRVNEFALNLMGDIENERMIMALVESYRTGKNQYYSLLNTVLKGVKEYDNPEIVPLLEEVATNKDLPYAIRLKSITSLASFNDERSIDAIIDMLKDPENYVFYNEILNLMNARGGYEIFKNRVRKVAFDAMVEYEKGKD